MAAISLARPIRRVGGQGSATSGDDRACAAETVADASGRAAASNAGTVALTEREGIGQQADGLQPGSQAGATLQVADAALAQSRPLGEGLLRQRRATAQLAQQVTEHSRGLAHRRPAWVHALADQGRAVVCRTSVPDGNGPEGSRCVRDACPMRPRCVSPRVPLRRMLGACQDEVARPHPGRARIW